MSQEALQNYLANLSSVDAFKQEAVAKKEESTSNIEKVIQPIQELGIPIGIEGLREATFKQAGQFIKDQGKGFLKNKLKTGNDDIDNAVGKLIDGEKLDNLTQSKALNALGGVEDDGLNSLRSSILSGNKSPLEALQGFIKDKAQQTFNQTKQEVQNRLGQARQELQEQVETRGEQLQEDGESLFSRMKQSLSDRFQRLTSRNQVQQMPEGQELSDFVSEQPENILSRQLARTGGGRDLLPSSSYEGRNMTQELDNMTTTQRNQYLRVIDGDQFEMGEDLPEHMYNYAQAQRESLVRRGLGIPQNTEEERLAQQGEIVRPEQFDPSQINDPGNSSTRIGDMLREQQQQQQQVEEETQEGSRAPPEEPLEPPTEPPAEPPTGAPTEAPTEAPTGAPAEGGEAVGSQVGEDIGETIGETVGETSIADVAGPLGLLVGLGATIAQLVEASKKAPSPPPVFSLLQQGTD